MSITDELREWAKEHLSRSSILAIADRIDAEHEKAVRELNNLAGACVPLPKDADGEYIYVGDVLTDGEHTFKAFELAAFGDGSWSIRNEDGNAWAACDVTRYHEPTVEDVLRELVRDLLHHIEYPPCEGCLSEMSCAGDLSQCDEYFDWLKPRARKLGVEVDG